MTNRLLWDYQTTLNNKLFGCVLEGQSYYLILIKFILSIEINNIIITLVIKPGLTWLVDSGLRLARV